MWAFAVGHNDEAVNFDAGIALESHYGFRPLTGFHLGGGHTPKLLGFGALPETVGAFSQTDHHHTARFRAVDPNVEIGVFAGEIKRRCQVNACAKRVRPKAGALHSQHLLRGVDGFAGQGVELGFGRVVDDGHMTRELPFAERRGFPSVVNPQLFPRGGFEIDGLCANSKGKCTCSDGKDMFEIHDETE